MRRIRVTPEAMRTLANHIDYMIAKDRGGAAQALKGRIDLFVTETLASYPRAGKYIAGRNLWEAWIPPTRLLV